ncbi:DUF3494 domain-containing protein [Methanobacterium sp. YSL]|nr:DUF3494 domain-containing protein [Methanobacterium sp. YSL]
MFNQSYRFKRIMLSLFILGAALFIISGCKPKAEVVRVESVSISAAGSATTITTIGGTLQFSAVVLPTDANDKAVTWSVQNGTGSGTITQNGLLTAVSDGTVTVKAIAKDNSAMFATKVITISNQSVVANSISVSSEAEKAFIDVYHGTLQMNALVLPENTVNKAVIWTVENGTGSASISTSGLLTAISDGIVTVKATSVNQTTVFGTKSITLSNQDASVTSVVISTVDNVAIINTFQGTLQLSVTVLPAIAVNKNVTWSVVNGTGSATISSTGLLTAVSNGVVTVHAVSISNSSVSDTMTITISKQEVLVTAIQLTSAGNVLIIDTFGGTLQFTSNVLPANASDKSVTWSVIPGSGSATISQTGLLTAVSNGTVTVVVTSNSNDDIDQTMIITLSHQEVLVNSISVNGHNSVLIIDTLAGTLQMEAIVLPTNAADKSLIWTVVNGTGSASISASGLLTAIQDGTVTVKAAATNNPLIFGTKVITISNQTVVEPQILAVDLKSAGYFTILSKSGLSTASISAIIGHIGVSPSPASYITGFSLIMDASNEYSTSAQVIGMIYASDYAVPTPAMLTAAIADMEAAYTDAAGRAPSFTELYAGDLSGQTLYTGVYKYGTDVLINTDLTLSGSATDVIIIQISGSLVQAAGVKVILTGGLLAENVFWQVAGDVSLGTNSHFEGIILSMTTIALGTGATMNGKLLAQTAITLDGNTINE